MAGLNRSDTWRVANYTHDALDFRNGSNYLTLNNQTDANTQDTSMLLLQYKIKKGTKFSLLLEYDSTVPIVYTPSLNKIVSNIQARQNEFVQDFESVFNVSKDSEYRDMTVYALANLVGGVSSYYGRLYLFQDNETQPEYPFFTATPTRNYYERGFMWDEGFHDLLICRWSVDLCLATLSTWFGSQYKTGWICREQSRGPEVQSMITPGFLF
mmetsp:Transcript_35083/g.31612  ORF Transcript_35083/g.31612 Transcript_35083/m.31612 type:complete len:212 (-) Transcript_35083:738-1373(-)